MHFVACTRNVDSVTIGNVFRLQFAKDIATACCDKYLFENHCRCVYPVSEKRVHCRPHVKDLPVGRDQCQCWREYEKLLALRLGHAVLRGEEVSDKPNTKFSGMSVQNYKATLYKKFSLEVDGLFRTQSVFAEFVKGNSAHIVKPKIRNHFMKFMNIGNSAELTKKQNGKSRDNVSEPALSKDVPRKLLDKAVKTDSLLKRSGLSVQSAVNLIVKKSMEKD